MSPTLIDEHEILDIVPLTPIFSYFLLLMPLSLIHLPKSSLASLPRLTIKTKDSGVTYVQSIPTLRGGKNWETQTDRKKKFMKNENSL